MTIIKVHHPFDASLEIIPMIIELCQAQATRRDLEMTSTKIFMPIALVVVIDLAYNQFSQNRTLTCCAPVLGLYMLHHMGKRVQFIKTLKHIK